MPNTVNYAEVWQPELLEIMTQETLCTPFITTNVRWLDARTFHFTSMAVSGFKEPGRIYPDRSPLHCDPRPGCGIFGGQG